MQQRGAGGRGADGHPTAEHEVVPLHHQAPSDTAPLPCTAQPRHLYNEANGSVIEPRGVAGRATAAVHQGAGDDVMGSSAGHSISGSGGQEARHPCPTASLMASRDEGDGGVVSHVQRHGVDEESDYGGGSSEEEDGGAPGWEL